VKDQYFGDVNDFRKYGLLRILTRDTGLRLGVCWMLTPPDGRTDGRHLSYLTKPTKFRRCDTELYDWLSRVIQGESDRRTARIEGTKLLGQSVFYSEVLQDRRVDREKWFAESHKTLNECDLIFYDLTTESSVQFATGSGTRAVRLLV